MGTGKNTTPTMHPAKVKLITLITEEGTSEEPLTIKPMVSNAVVKTDAVSSDVYKVLSFLFLPAETPASTALRKLIKELTYPRLFSVHPNSLKRTEATRSMDVADIIHTKQALRRKAES